jgi:hypothetical protein
MHGVELVEKVIRKVERDGFDILGTCGIGRIAKPQPIPANELATLAFPNGKSLSPALRRWLAYDASWLGWFEDPKRPAFAPKKLGPYATAEYGLDWGYGVIGFDDDVFGLHFGSDSRRFLYVGEPDSIGEYPVLLADTDDSPYLGVEYPGIDVYLAINAGVVNFDGGVYGALLGHAVYGKRMKQHAKRYFGGTCGVDIMDLVGDPAEFWVTLTKTNADVLVKAKKPKKAAPKRAKKAVPKKPAKRRR